MRAALYTIPSRDHVSVVILLSEICLLADSFRRTKLFLHENEKNDAKKSFLQTVHPFHAILAEK